MIPHIIHCCWFGNNSLPTIAQECINSWKEKIPEYKILLWNETNFDVSSNYWTQEAYNCGDFAFVSDYVRVYALKNYGGIYLDVDIEILKDFSNLLLEKEYVSCFVEGYLLTCGFIACEKNSSFINRVYEYYKDRHYIVNGVKNNIMNPLIYTKIASTYFGLRFGSKSFYIDNISIFPEEYFMPYSKNTLVSQNENIKKYKTTNNTYTIHHNLSSWHNKRNKIICIARALLPQTFYLIIKKIIFKRKLKMIDL